MRYWLLTTEYPPFYGGGISTYCSITANMLSTRGHDVTVFLPDFSVNGVDEIKKDHLRIVRFCPRKTDSHKFLGYTANLSYEFSEIVREYILAEGKPDVIESHEYGGIAYYLLQFKWQCIHPFTDLKVIITCHSPSFICLEYNQVPIYRFPDYWTGEMEKSCIKSADLVLFPSQYLVSEIEQRLSLKNVRYSILPNPISSSLEHEEAPVENVDSQMVVCFGKLAPLKGSFELLAYFEKLWKAGSALKLFIIGGTDYFFHPEGKTMFDLIVSKYKQFIDDGRLVLTGNLPLEKYSDYLLKAKVVVVPSLFDNFPYTVLEAMSLGKVVLASRQGGQSEMIIHGRNGFLFDHRKENDFQYQLESILSLTNSALKEIRSNCLATIRSSYSGSFIYPQKERVIVDVLNGPSPRSEYPFITDIAPREHEVSISIDEEEPLLSVIVPYYNMGDFVEDTLLSIFQSDYKNLEVIVIDDGSTQENSIRKLQEIEGKYPVSIIRRSNTGLSATRNFGASIAKGLYIAFLDSDDKVAPSYYRKAVTILKRYNNVHFVGCWLNYCGEGQGTWPTFNPEPPSILIHNTINSSAIVVKRETFVNRGCNSVEMIYGMEDWESVIKMVGEGYRGVVIPEKLFEYRVRKGSMSQSFTIEKQLYLIKLIAHKHRSFYNRYGAEIFQLLNSNGSALYFDNPTFEVIQQLPFKRLSHLKSRVKEYIKRNKALRKTAYFIYRRLK